MPVRALLNKLHHWRQNGARRMVIASSGTKSLAPEGKFKFLVAKVVDTQ